MRFHDAALRNWWPIISLFCLPCSIVCPRRSDYRSAIESTFVLIAAFEGAVSDAFLLSGCHHGKATTNCAVLLLFPIATQRSAARSASSSPFSCDFRASSLLTVILAFVAAVVEFLHILAARVLYWVRARKQSLIPLARTRYRKADAYPLSTFLRRLWLAVSKSPCWLSWSSCLHRRSQDDVWRLRLAPTTARSSKNASRHLIKINFSRSSRSSRFSKAYPYSLGCQIARCETAQMKSSFSLSHAIKTSRRAETLVDNSSGPVSILLPASRSGMIISLHNILIENSETALIIAVRFRFQSAAT